MKTFLVAINSQYVHMNLAVLYLKAACDKELDEVKTLDFSINEPIKHIFSAIINEKPDIVAFSCYIWNIEYTIKLAEDIKKANPEIIIIAGGPEVSFDNGGLLESNEFVDYIIAGDGEEKLPFLLKRIREGIKLSNEEKKQLRSFSVVSRLDTLRSPYQFIEKDSLKNKIAYVEASRGCPFHCSYCMSSVTDGVRSFPVEKVFDALKVLSDSGARIIKFVDRTFNCNEKKALDIWNHIQKYKAKDIVFHFEVDPGLITQNMLDCLEKMPPGLVQLEAGIQSVHAETLEAVERPGRIEKALMNIEKVISFNNIHLHVDLIAGLPYESYEKFSESFNRVYKLGSHHFQLGFLKLLRGSALREKAELHGIKYSSYPPYEIIKNNYMDAGEFMMLKDIAACLELFYNSGRFVTSLIVVNTASVVHSKGKNIGINIDKNIGLSLPDSFGFFEKLAMFMRRKGYLDRPIKAFNLYEIFYVFIKNRFPFLTDVITECLRFDYLRSMKNLTLPVFLKRNEDNKKARQEMLNIYCEEIEKVLPRLKNISLDRIWHQVFIDDFDLPPETGYPQKAVIAFDFGDVSPVTGLAGAYCIIDFQLSSKKTKGTKN
jgi:radical SAM superfamily enzyme YgiQ (UPF0313 family)